MIKAYNHIVFFFYSILVLFIPETIFCQDIHFSLFDWQANYNNPALTGINPETQVGLQYRDQGFRVSENSYRSYSLFADSYMNREVRKYDHLGVGGSIIVDKAGAGKINTMEALVNLAYHFSIDQKSATYLSMSPQVGFIQRELGSLEDLTFEEELLGGTFTEQFLNSNSQYLDAGFGITLRRNFSERTSIMVGYSVQHLNDAKSDFSELNVEKISRRSHWHANIVYPLSKNINTESQIHYHNSDVFRELILKQNFNYQLNGETLKYLDFGLAYRNRDAYIMNFGLSLNQIDIALAYELNSSELNQASRPAALIELGIKYHIPFKVREESLFVPYLLSNMPDLMLLKPRVLPIVSLVDIEEKGDIDISSIHPTKIIKLEHIYFDFDKDEIKPSYKQRLNEIKNLIEHYPEGKWIIIAHTDSRGSKVYNLELSQRRLNNVITWFQNNDISMNYVTTIFKGESELVNNCHDDKNCTPIEHRLNRRVTISVTVTK